MPNTTKTAAHYSDILVALTSADEEDAALAAADALASGGGHVTAVLVEPLPDVLYAIEQGAPALTLADDLLVLCRRDAEAAAAKLADKVSRLTAQAQSRLLAEELVLASNDLVMAARHADLTVFARPQSDEDTRWKLLTDVLFRSGRPLFLAPPKRKRFDKMDNVLVAWNASRESARALADAAPFLAEAKNVRVITVDAKPSMSGHGDLPGADIAAHLARRGVKIELSNLASNGEADGAVIEAEAKRFGADLLVLGGYGHSRLGEMMFGGVTRRLLTHAPCPMLLSH